VLRAVVSYVSAEIDVKLLFDQFDDTLMRHWSGRSGPAFENDSC
jgi:hypothetical protein